MRTLDVEMFLDVTDIPQGTCRPDRRRCCSRPSARPTMSLMMPTRRSRRSSCSRGARRQPFVGVVKSVSADDDAVPAVRPAGAGHVQGVDAGVRPAARRAEPDVGRAAQQPSSHQVVLGDSLASIANAEYGTPTLWRAIAAANELEDPFDLRIGSELLHPRPRRRRRPRLSHGRPALVQRLRRSRSTARRSPTRSPARCSRRSSRTRSTCPTRSSSCSAIRCARCSSAGRFEIGKTADDRRRLRGDAGGHDDRRRRDHRRRGRDRARPDADDRARLRPGPPPAARHDHRDPPRRHVRRHRRQGRPAPRPAARATAAPTRSSTRRSCSGTRPTGSSCRRWPPRSATRSSSSTAQLHLREPGDSASAPGGGDLGSDDARQLVVGGNLLRLRATVSGAEQVEEVQVRGLGLQDEGGRRGRRPRPPTGRAAPSAGAGAADLAEQARRRHARQGRPAGRRAPRSPRTPPSRSSSSSAARRPSSTAWSHGNPELRAGVPSAWPASARRSTGSYVLTSCRHTYDPANGYLTAFRVSGRQNRTMLGLVNGGARRRPQRACAASCRRSSATSTTPTSSAG